MKYNVCLMPTVCLMDSIKQTCWHDAKFPVIHWWSYFDVNSTKSRGSLDSDQPESKQAKPEKSGFSGKSRDKLQTVIREQVHLFNLLLLIIAFL